MAFQTVQFNAIIIINADLQNPRALNAKSPNNRLGSLRKQRPEKQDQLIDWSTLRFLLIQGIISRSRVPTFSIRCSRPRRRFALKVGVPA